MTHTKHTCMSRREQHAHAHAHAQHMHTRTTNAQWTACLGWHACVHMHVYDVSVYVHCAVVSPLFVCVLLCLMPVSSPHCKFPGDDCPPSQWHACATLASPRACNCARAVLLHVCMLMCLAPHVLTRQSTVNVIIRSIYTASRNGSTHRQRTNSVTHSNTRTRTRTWHIRGGVQ